jgi:hypothetical protein
MKADKLIHIVLGGLLALPVCPSNAAITTITYTTTFNVEGVESGMTKAESSLSTWSHGGEEASRADGSEASGAIEVAHGGGIFTGSGRVSVIQGEIDNGLGSPPQPSVSVSITETFYTLFRLTGISYKYYFISSVDARGNVMGGVNFLGNVNTNRVNWTVSGFLAPGDYSLSAGMSDAGLASGGEGTWSYALSLVPFSVGGKYTPAEKQDLSLAGSSYRLLCQDFLIAAHDAPSQYQKEFLSTSTELSQIGTALLDVSVDPLDTNYTVLAQAVAPAVVPLVAGGGVTQPEADAYNLWQTNLSLSAAYSTAMATSIDRAQGAAYAGSPSWETAQMNGAVQFEAQLASLFDQEPALRSNVVAQFQAGGFQDITVSSNDVGSFQMEIATNGLPADLLDGLTALGLDGDTITNLQNTLLTADPGTLAGGFPGSLANTNLDSTSPTLAADLRDASLVLINASLLPGGQFRFDLPTEPGYTYAIQFTGNPADSAAWTTIFTTNAATALLSFTNTPASGARAGFYRALHN